MRLISLTVENFRCYKEPTSLRFGDLTALVGRNDIGKSSLMDALGIFFNEISLDKDDACKLGDPKAVMIMCEFDQLPNSLIIDTEFPTTLANEFLLSSSGTIKIRKTYNGSLATPKLTAVEAIALHPTAENYSDLLSLKKTELEKRAKLLGVDLEGVDKRANAPIRTAIWDNCGALGLQEGPVLLDAEGGKQVWSALQSCLPTFALFKSDRASTDQDAEAQDPLKAAIREAIREVEPELQKIRDHVEREVTKIAEATVEKLREMDATIADTLKPVVSTKKWDSLFSTSITGDEDIPFNKRGTGVKRLVLLNFFRAQAEKNVPSNGPGSIIYAIEEPETGQHPRNQRLILNALRNLATGDGRQVIITTHTPMLARYLNDSDLRFIDLDANGVRDISEVNSDTSSRIATSLGVLPDHNVKLFIGVEGSNDINFLTRIASILIASGENVPNLGQLEIEGVLIFIPLGGSNLALWSSRLSHLNRHEYHICDRDYAPPKEAKYAQYVKDVNTRETCKAVVTNKRELENYLHPDAIREAYSAIGTEIDLPISFEAFDDVPEIVAKALHGSSDTAWEDLLKSKKDKKISRAKKILNSVSTERMTLARLTETDPDNEIKSWLLEIGQIIAKESS